MKGTRSFEEAVVQGQIVSNTNGAERQCFDEGAIAWRGVNVKQEKIGTVMRMKTILILRLMLIVLHP
uniref:Uncharacterized protein n=1 Tax=Heterorhabditis bacteriophora TaxID=37862 RepID=A0A1I7XD74_HETBA